MLNINNSVKFRIIVMMIVFALLADAPTSSAIKNANTLKLNTVVTAEPLISTDVYFPDATNHSASFHQNFTTINLNTNETLFNHYTITLIGNGLLMYNMTFLNKEKVIGANKSILLTWKDFGPSLSATYIGVFFKFNSSDNQIRQLTIAKHIAGNYLNSSTSLKLFANPNLPYGKYWEQWGVETNVLFKYYNVTNLTLIELDFYNANSASYMGKRKVSYAIPLLVDTLIKDPQIAKGPYLGNYNSSNYVISYINTIKTSNKPSFVPLNIYSIFLALPIMVFLDLYRKNKKFKLK